MLGLKFDTLVFGVQLLGYLCVLILLYKHELASSVAILLDCHSGL